MKKFFSILSLTIALLVPTVSTVPNVEASDARALINSAPLKPTFTGFDPCDRIVCNTLNRIVKPNMDTYAKVKVCYDYLIESCMYGDNRTMNRYPVGTVDEGPILAYSILTEHVGACDHYSCAFAALVRAIGLNCYTIYGQTARADGGFTGHIWTVIKIDGVEYVFDPQIDDNIAKGGPIGYYRFCVRYDETPGSYANHTLSPYFMPINY